MPDMSNVLAALARAAAEYDGHRCGAFTVRPDGRVGCLCGQWTYEVAPPVIGTEASAA